MESLVRKEANKAIDALEVALLSRFKKIECPLNHVFADQLYIREIFMPKGSKITSKVHKKKHPYFILRGAANIWIDGQGWQFISAPHFGITEAGTRRVLDILEDMSFITVHSNPNDSRDLNEIEDMVIEKHDNIFLQKKETE